MNEVLKMMNGKKTWIGLFLLAVIGFAGDVGWAAPEQLVRWTHLAQWLAGAGILHKVEKLIRGFAKK